MTPQQRIKNIEKLEDELFNTGIVQDIEYDARYIITYFSEELGGVRGIRMAHEGKKGATMQKILNKINELQKKESLFKEVA